MKFSTRLALLLVVCAPIFLGCNAANRQNALGRASFLNGQYSQAINQFQQALNANPQNSDAIYNLGATYYTLGKQSRNTQWINQAEQLYRQAIATNDQHIDAHRALAGLLVESGRKSYAFDLLNSWRQRYPTSAEPLIELASLYTEFGDQNQATNLLADALQVDGTSTRALKAMGYIRETQGQLNLALDNYLRSYQLDSRQVDVATKINTLQTRIAQGFQNPNGNSVLAR
ncbi:tetratricopeptide repeat protein [bacterium]|nr:tetratricopeptide repeat protein [bacterium]